MTPPQRTMNNRIAKGNVGCTKVIPFEAHLSNTTVLTTCNLWCGNGLHRPMWSTYFQHHRRTSSAPRTWHSHTNHKVSLFGHTDHHSPLQVLSCETVFETIPACRKLHPYTHKSSGISDVSSPQKHTPILFSLLSAYYKAAGSAHLGHFFSSSEIRLHPGTCSGYRLSSSPTHKNKATNVSRNPFSRASMPSRAHNASHTKEDNSPRLIGALVGTVVSLIILGIIIGLWWAGCLGNCGCRRRRSSEDREGQA